MKELGVKILFRTYSQIKIRLALFTYILNGKTQKIPERALRDFYIFYLCTT